MHSEQHYGWKGEILVTPSHLGWKHILKPHTRVTLHTAFHSIVFQGKLLKSSNIITELQHKVMQSIYTLK